MDTRRLIGSVIVAGGAGLLFLDVQPDDHQVYPKTEVWGAAQVAASNIVHVKHLPHFGVITTQPWEAFKVTTPATASSLDMHVGFLVDGHGTEYVTQRQTIWPQPLLARLWVDCGDYERLNGSRTSQQPIKQRRVNFDFVAGSQASLSGHKTLRFTHGTTNVGVLEVTDSGEGTLGDKLILYDREIEDTMFHGYSRKWQDSGYVSKFPPGMVHRLTVYIQFQPHLKRVLSGRTVTAYTF